LFGALLVGYRCLVRPVDGTLSFPRHLLRMPLRCCLLSDRLILRLLTTSCILLKRSIDLGQQPTLLCHAKVPFPPLLGSYACTAQAKPTRRNAQYSQLGVRSPGWHW
jgi:hypothetical protein